MARHISPDSVSSKVMDLKVNEDVIFDNPYTSVAVMVSNLKKKEEHQYKIFKIKISENKTQVTRLR